MGINDKYIIPPLNSEFEFSLLGRGKAYGESIVLHLGNNEWGIIDNCINQKTKESLALEYLYQLKVPFDNVQFIVCTHWHQDHTTNITSLFEKCPNAKFYVSAALNCRDFETLLCIKGNIKSFFNPTRQFLKLMEYARDTKRKVIRVNQDKTLFSNFIGGQNLKVFALSPTEETIHHFEKTTKKMMENIFGLESIVRKPEPNLQSVVCYIKIGDFSILLGGDLENDNKEGLGWQGVLESVELNANTKKSIIFKIPHHGSENAYDEKIWKQMVMFKKAHVVTTPLVRGKNTLLPNSEMIQNICHFSKNFYLTSNPYSIKPSKHSRDVQKYIRRCGLNISKVAQEFGQVRFRKDFSKENTRLRIEKFGEGCKINCPS